MQSDSGEAYDPSRRNRSLMRSCGGCAKRFDQLRPRATTNRGISFSWRTRSSVSTATAASAQHVDVEVAAVVSMRRRASPRARTRPTRRQAAHRLGGCISQVVGCRRVCLIRVLFSRVLGTLIKRRQFGTRRSGVKADRSWIAPYLGNGTNCGTGRVG